MATLPTIVRGNSFALAIPLKVYVIGEGEVVLVDYTPDEGDSITVQLRGNRRVYSYTPTTEGNVATISLAGNELAGLYDTVVTIIKDDDTHLRAFKSGQLAIVESVDDMTEGELADGINAGAIYLDPQIFIRGEQGEDGRGIVSITKTTTSGLVDTYTITYTDGTTSTFTVTNGADGEDGQDGANGVGIASITEQTSSASGGVNVVTVTLTDGTQSSFTVRNGIDGQTPDMSQYALKSDLATKADLNGSGNEDFAVASLNASNVVFGGYATISGAAPTIQVTNTIGGTTVQFPHDRSGELALTNDLPDMTEYYDKTEADTLLADKADVTTLVEVTATGDVTQALDSGKFYKFGEVDSLTLTLTAASAGMAIYGGKFTASTNWSALGLPATVDEAAGNDTVASGKTYEFNIIDNVIVLKEV